MTEAQVRVLALGEPVATEHVPLSRAAGRYAAAPALASRTQPVADLSAMDGYAISFASLPGPWTLVGESAAGRPYADRIASGETIRIFTGAAMPPGADCVLVQEEAKAEGGTVHLCGEGPRRVGGNVRPRGLDFAHGDTLIAHGERIGPARLALAAIGGLSHVAVRRTVRVAIAATGDELVPHGTPTTGAQLPESNGLMLAALLADLPAEVIDLGILPDRLDALSNAFAAVDADLLVTTGGASVGDHDLVRPALEAAGAVIDFWRIALRPGKPMMAGRLRRTAVLGLPGNPVSAFVTAVLFVRPLVKHLAGAADPFPQAATAPLGEPLPPNDGRADYLRGRLVDGQLHVSGIQDSSVLRTLARADALVIRPPHAPAAPVGELARYLPF